ncbi:MAG TPA: error-prone DNA polymerase [Pseudomonadales bacterium]
MATSDNPDGANGANRKPRDALIPGQRLRSQPYAELHALSNYSFLRGASHPEELVAQAASLGYQAIALTDECSFAGLVKAHMAAKEHDIQLIVGAEFHLEEGIHLVLLVPDRNAYGQLSGLITRLRRRSPKGTYRMTLNDLNWGIDGCLALWVPELGSIETLMAQGQALQSRFPELWIALELFLEATDLDKTANALTVSLRLDLPIVAAGEVHMHIPARQSVQDVLTAIRLKTTVSELGSRAFANAERHLRPLETLAAIFPPELIAETVRIARRCTFSMDELRYEYPEELVPPHLTPSQYLRQLTLAGAAERWPDGIPDDTLALVEQELALIKALHYEYYFLTVQDIVQFARSQSILCQGRGSAANSAVCYCLHITEVDPSRMHLLFERFVSKERDEPPDIDVDFEHERREEVIQYLYKRYGRHRAALAATLITYRPKSAVRDVGKALGMDPDLVDLLARSLSWWDKPAELEARLKNAGLNPKSAVVVQFLCLVNELLGFPRHLSQHVGGFVISRGPLAQLVPVENAAMAERTVIQWDKDDLEALGLLKVDVLGLGMLTAIRKSLSALNAYRGTDLKVADIPAEDSATYRMLQKGDSVGVFQVESRAQMAMLPRLKPKQFYDLVIEVAIVRPGPIQGDMVHPYLRRRQGVEAVTYPSEEVRKVLERTLGVPIFQEQVIELAMVAAGFSGGEADQLRRAMAAWKRRGGLGHFEQKLIDGMLARGHDRDFAERVFRQIEGFGEYGFPESHAASFALLVYISAWLKRHEPAAFYCGLLNSLPMGFYSPSQLIQDARRHGLTVQPADAQESDWDHRLDPICAPPGEAIDSRPALRLGLRMVKGLSEESGRRIEMQKPFRDPQDLMRRARLNNQELRFLARAGALKTLIGHRYQSHWEVAALQEPTALQAVAESPEQYVPSAIELAPPSVTDDMLDDYRYTSLTLGPHPMSLLRSRPELEDCRSALDLQKARHGQMIQVAGLVTGRQRPSSASGVLFVTLEDETGNVNVVVWTSVLARYRAVILQGQLLRVHGTLEREKEVIHVVAGHVQDATGLLIRLSAEAAEDVPFRSRDFR